MRVLSDQFGWNQARLKLVARPTGALSIQNAGPAPKVMLRPTSGDFDQNGVSVQLRVV